MKPLLYLTLTCLGFSVNNHALAQTENTNIRQDENCFQVGWIFEKLDKFSDLKSENKDSVGVSPSAYLILEDSSQHYPERYFLKDQDIETDLSIAPDGQLMGFEKLSHASKDVELCNYDPKRTHLPFKADGISLDINTDVQFHNNSGMHNLDEIRDGLKDGRAHYKKTAGAMAMFVPKMSHIMIKYDYAAQPLKFAPMKGGVELTEHIPIVYCVLPMIKVKDLEDIGADTLKISGGNYRLLPVPNLNAMKRFEGCDEDEG